MIHRILQKLGLRRDYLSYLFDCDCEYFRKHLASVGLNRARYELRVLTHSIEKAFSLYDHRKEFGVEKICNICKIIQELEPIASDTDTWLIDYAKEVVTAYYQHRKSNNLSFDFIPDNCITSDEDYCATVEYKWPQLTDKTDFETFARSRRSSRCFSSRKLDDEIISRAVYLAQTTPSACNRQSVRIHAVKSPEKISSIMSFHGGTRGFQIPACVFVVTGDVTFYRGEYERNTVYTDCGLFMMNLIYALHNEGLVTCPVIWGNIPENDRFLKDLIDIPEQERITGLIFCGYQPGDSIQAAFSKRVPLEHILTIC